MNKPLIFKGVENDQAVLLQLRPTDSMCIAKALYIRVPHSINSYLSAVMTAKGHKTMLVYTNLADINKSQRATAREQNAVFYRNGGVYEGYTTSGDFVYMCKKGAERVFKLLPGTKKFTLYYLFEN